jgi:hypothetical protein
LPLFLFDAKVGQEEADSLRETKGLSLVVSAIIVVYGSEQGKRKYNVVIGS